MSGRIDEVTQSAKEQIGGFAPDSGDELHQFFTGLPDFFTELGGAFTSAAENMTDEHIHPGVLDALRELGSVVAGMSDHAQQVYDEHRSQHDLWLNKG